MYQFDEGSVLATASSGSGKCAEVVLCGSPAVRPSGDGDESQPQLCTASRGQENTKQIGEKCSEERGGLSLSGASLNLLNVVTGCGILALPSCLLSLGGSVPFLLLLTSAYLSNLFAIYLLLECALVSGRLSYTEIARAACGRVGVILVSVSVILQNVGSAVSYAVVVGDVLPAVLSRWITVSSPTPSLQTAGTILHATRHGQQPPPAAMDGTLTSSTTNGRETETRKGFADGGLRGLCIMACMFLVVYPLCLKRNLTKLKFASGLALGIYWLFAAATVAFYFLTDSAPLPTATSLLFTAQERRGGEEQEVDQGGLSPQDFAHDNEELPVASFLQSFVETSVRRDKQQLDSDISRGFRRSPSSPEWKSTASANNKESARKDAVAEEKGEPLAFIEEEEGEEWEAEDDAAFADPSFPRRSFFDLEQDSTDDSSSPDGTPRRKRSSAHVENDGFAFSFKSEERFPPRSSEEGLLGSPDGSSLLYQLHQFLDVLPVVIFSFNSMTSILPIFSQLLARQSRRRKSTTLERFRNCRWLHFPFCLLVPPVRLSAFPQQLPTAAPESDHLLSRPSSGVPSVSSWPSSSMNKLRAAHQDMLMVTSLSYFLTLLLYVVSSFFGFYTFASSIQPNVLDNYPTDSSSLNAIRVLMVAATVLGCPLTLFACKGVIIYIISRVVVTVQRPLSALQKMPGDHYVPCHSSDVLPEGDTAAAVRLLEEDHRNRPCPDETSSLAKRRSLDTPETTLQQPFCLSYRPQTETAVQPISATSTAAQSLDPPLRAELRTNKGKGTYPSGAPKSAAPLWASERSRSRVGSGTSSSSTSLQDNQSLIRARASDNKEAAGGSLTQEKRQTALAVSGLCATSPDNDRTEDEKNQHDGETLPPMATANIMHVATTTLLVVAVTVIAMAVPNVKQVLAWTGSTATLLVCFWMPSFFYLLLTSSSADPQHLSSRYESMRGPQAAAVWKQRAAKLMFLMSSGLVATCLCNRLFSVAFL